MKTVRSATLPPLFLLDRGNRMNQRNTTMTDYVIVEGRTLARAMRIATAVVERRSTLPILSCVKLTYGPACFSIEATDLDMEVKIAVDEIEGSGEWTLCVEATNLEKIASVAGVANLRIMPTIRQVVKSNAKGMADGTREQRGATVIIGDNEAIYEIDNAQPADDWPTIGNARTGSIERFTNGMLAATLRKVAWAISTEETRYYLNGVCWQMRAGGRRFVATDGHRLSLCRYSSDEGANADRIISRRAVAFITKFFDGLDVEIFATDRQGIIDIVAPALSLRTKLIDGTFPDVDRVIPVREKINATLALKRDEIETAIRQAVAVGDRSGPAIRFYGIDGKLNIERRNVSFGTARVRTSTAWPEQVQPFGLNSRYMLEIVGNCQGTISLGIEGPGSPFLVADNDDSMTRVIMPMRV